MTVLRLVPNAEPPAEPVRGSEVLDEMIELLTVRVPRVPVDDHNFETLSELLFTMTGQPITLRRVEDGTQQPPLEGADVIDEIADMLAARMPEVSMDDPLRTSVRELKLVFGAMRLSPRDKRRTV